MDHASDSHLGLHEIAPALVPRRTMLEVHLASCDVCRTKLEQVRNFDAALREPETWMAATAAVADTRRNDLRGFFLRMEREDAAAISLLRDFESPDAAVNFVYEDIALNTEYQNGGVARRLCQLANGMCERRPFYALSLAEAATRIAEILPDSNYPRNTIHNLRGDAWKERANAYRFLGRLTDALHALDHADSEYRKLPVEGIGIAAVQYVRAYVLYEQERLDDAEVLAGESAARALHLGDVDRFMRAQHLKGEILYERRRFREAAEVFARIRLYGEKHSQTVWIARESLTLGQCHLELNELPAASTLLHEALRLFSGLRFEAEETRAVWAIARLQFAEGMAPQATYRLRTAIDSLTRLGMLTDAAIASVDLAEMLHALSRTREIPKLLSGVVQTFIKAGKLTGALSALAYLKDEAAAGHIPVSAFPHVRRFLARADRQSDLLFAPPP